MSNIADRSAYRPRSEPMPGVNRPLRRVRTGQLLGGREPRISDRILGLAIGICCVLSGGLLIAWLLLGAFGPQAVLL